MKQIVRIGAEALRKGQVDLYQQVSAGKPMGNPVALTGPSGSAITTWDDLKPKDTASNAGEYYRNRFFAALYREAMYSTAGGVWVRGFGMRQTAREINDFVAEQTKVGVTQ